MRVSIITVSYNSESTIEAAILSVLSQSYTDIEYLIIDGGSHDRTTDIIEKYEDKIGYWVSEPDQGMYYALNKGLRAATGDVIGILNSDDFYANENVIQKVANTFKNENIGCTYGDLVYVDKKNVEKHFRYWKAGEFKKDLLKRGWMPPHPTFFVRKEVYEEF